jgi:hypothetical protein
MSHSTTIRFAPGAGEGWARHLWHRLADAFAATRQRWQQAAQLRATHQAIRGLDRRTRQDLGLYAGDEPDARSLLLTEFGHLRW